MIKRIYVERKPGHDIEAQCLYRDLKENLGIGGIKKLRLLKRFDVEGITEEEYLLAKNTVFSQSQVDITYDEKAPIDNCRHFEMELLPGQYDQQADFSAQCLQILTMGKKPNVRTGTLIVLEGNITDKQLDEIKKYCINPVESREVSTKKPATLKHEYKAAKEINVLDGFIEKNEDELNDFISELGLAMDLEDLKFCQAYFRDTEKRNPTITEIRVLDTYWSDHCRHSTFLTELCDIKINDNKIQEVFQDYLKHKDPNKPVCLMDMATSSIKRLKAEGKLDNLDDSEEINASSIEVMADIDGKKEPWLIMFKNETHNHPTEIEPFGGASTCLGGAIRDPLSGRSYVYQSMRVTGSGDPRKKISETLKGKLPQRVITKVATKGFSSYGNQIGLATGQGTEIYDEGYIAKRMELGAVIAAAPKENVIRKTPSPGDVIILLGGRTGRDGCGGATSSSKAHDETSLEVCGAEVQRGNPSEERKIVRLFRKKEVTTLIKKCNDFGAGGVSVAIGELADGLFINLDAVPKKYEGLDGTELAISESQERMAVVVAPENADKFIEYAKEENLEATIIAKVTKSPRLVMQFGGKTIVDISREFLNTNGTRKKAAAEVPPANAASFFKQREATDIKKEWLDTLSSLRQCSQKGLVEHFDSTIGRGTILLPFGGKAQLTPAQVMAAKLPVLNQNTNTATIMSFGYNPVLFKQSPFHGAVYSLVEAASKVVASGGNLSNIRFTLQEYFERLGDDPKRWGKPVAALLGAYYAQIKMGLASIGGKDSMSGSFLDIDVPPTLVAFAVCPTDAREIISNEFKAAGHKLVLVAPRYDNNNLPDFEDLKDKYEKINKLIKSGKVYSANAIGQDGAFELAKATFGNKIGMKLDKNSDLFKPLYGAIVLEVDEEIGFGEVIGETIDDENIICGTAKITIDEAIKVWKQPLEDIYPSEYEKVKYPKLSYANRSAIKSASTFAKPTVFIPIFPETNCEYDSAVAFEKAGAKIETFVMKNLSPEDIKYSVDMISKHIRQSQIVMLAGGYSAGDEPGGSSKFAVTVFKNEKVKDAINDLLKNRDGLILGIGSGFQALLRLGLVPFGEIREMDDTCPTLTYNTIGRHISCMVKTRVASVLSPWFADFNVGDESWIPISHGEGRFVASDEMVQKLIENGQIATQYVDINPNGSVYVIEGITSPDGRILGKMGHNERIDENIAINIPGNKGQNIYLSGVNYFK